MKIGDLIKFEDDYNQAVCDDHRRVGTVLGFDYYHSGDNRNRLGARGIGESIVEVLWNTGKIGWILKSRVEKFNVD